MSKSSPKNEQTLRVSSTGRENGDKRKRHSRKKQYTKVQSKKKLDRWPENHGAQYHSRLELKKDAKQKEGEK